MTAPIIHLCSWPGAGKATIGRVLAARLGGRLIDNHLMLDPASALFDRNDPRHAALRAVLRSDLHKAALSLAPDIPLILTDALADTPGDRVLFQPVFDLAKARGANLLPITLDISASENRRRLLDPARTARAKLADPDILDTLRNDHCLLRPKGAISLDVSTLFPEQAATGIIEALALQPGTAP